LRLGSRRVGIDPNSNACSNAAAPTSACSPPPCPAPS
jgi:hypothetical protein